MKMKPQNVRQVLQEVAQLQVAEIITERIQRKEQTTIMKTLKKVK